MEHGAVAPGGIGAQATNAFTPAAARADHVLEVRGVGAIDHVVGGVAVGRNFGALDRVGQRVAGRQPPIGFGRERDRRRPGVRAERCEVDLSAMS